MKEKKSFVTQTLRTLDSEIQKKVLDSKQSISDELVINVLQKGIKKIQDSFEAFIKGNRKDLAQQEESEMHLYKHYLPKQMEEEEIKAIVQKIISNTPTPNIGLIMKQVAPLTKGKADGKLVNQIVQNELRGMKNVETN
jgi:uncharacterized protein YqeY